MTPRESFLSALRGEMPEYVPMTIWSGHVPEGQLNRLTDLGVAVITKCPVWKLNYDRVEIRIQEEGAGEGRTKRILHYHTPAGTLRQIETVTPGTTWILEFMCKSPSDFKALEYFLLSKNYTPDFDHFLEVDAFSDSSIVSSNFPRTLSCTPGSAVTSSFLIDSSILFSSFIIAPGQNWGGHNRHSSPTLKQSSFHFCSQRPHCSVTL